MVEVEPLLVQAVVGTEELAEATLPFDGPESVADRTEPILRRTLPEEYPHLTELAVEHILQPGNDFGWQSLAPA